MYQGHIILFVINAHALVTYQSLIGNVLRGFVPAARPGRADKIDILSLTIKCIA